MSDQFTKLPNLGILTGQWSLFPLSPMNDTLFIRRSLPTEEIGLKSTLIVSDVWGWPSWKPEETPMTYSCRARSDNLDGSCIYDFMSCSFPLTTLGVTRIPVGVDTVQHLVLTITHPGGPRLSCATLYDTMLFLTTIRLYEVPLCSISYR